jgi:hypothetical protein
MNVVNSAPRRKVESGHEDVLAPACRIKGETYYGVTLRIADVVIHVRSKFPGKLFSKKDSWRLQNFIYQGDEKPDITLDVHVVDKLPGLAGAKKFFTTIHPQTRTLSWSLYKKNGRYVLRSFRAETQHDVVLNAAFDRGTAYFPSGASKKSSWAWDIDILIHDAIQIILINYLTQRDGIFLHAVGLKDVDGTGRVFVGESGAGKSTTARLWHTNSRAVILNDDRIIVRKRDGNFIIYGSPWHGDFNDYLATRTGSAVIPCLHFIYHCKKNVLKPISKGQAFGLLYPNIFPVFWNKEGVKRTLSFCHDMIESLPCRSLGFRKEKSVIRFVRAAHKTIDVQALR